MKKWLGLCALLLLSCSDTQVSGGSVSTENVVKAKILQDSSWTIGASHVSFRKYAIDSLLAPQEFFLNEHGELETSNLDSGFYFVQIESAQFGYWIDSLEIKGNVDLGELSLSKGKSLRILGMIPNEYEAYLQSVDWPTKFDLFWGLDSVLEFWPTESVSFNLMLASLPNSDFYQISAKSFNEDTLVVEAAMKENWLLYLCNQDHEEGYCFEFLYAFNQCVKSHYGRLKEINCFESAHDFAQNGNKPFEGNSSIFGPSSSSVQVIPNLPSSSSMFSSSEIKEGNEGKSSSSEERAKDPLKIQPEIMVE